MRRPGVEMITSDAQVPLGANCRCSLAKSVAPERADITAPHALNEANSYKLEKSLRERDEYAFHENMDSVPTDCDKPVLSA